MSVNLIDFVMDSTGQSILTEIERHNGVLDTIMETLSISQENNNEGD